MRLIRKYAYTGMNGDIKVKLPPWKVLVVDDEPDVHAIARLNLKHFEFAGKRLRFFEAMSGQEARDILAVEPDIAVALIDIVMETDDAGLRLVEYIRNELHNDFIRLVIRTGQPGVAPERHVIEHYDIDDYKDKTELTTQKLYTTMRTALKSFRDLGIIDSNRRGLKKILDTTPTLYQPQEINRFFSNVLSQVIDLCKDNFIATITDGLLMTANDRQVIVQCGSGRFEKFNDNEVDTITQVCMSKLTHITNNGQLPSDAMLIPLMGNTNLLGFVYLEGAKNLSPDDQDLIHVLVNQCASALENLQLYLNLKEANHQTLNMLAIAEQARTMAESANRAKSTFLANMSHELRTPLNAILGYTDIVYEDAVDANCGDMVGYLEEIRGAGNKLLGIISDILDISQIETSKVKLNLAEFPVIDLIEEVVNAVQPIIKTIGNTLTVEYNREQLGTLYADQQKVKQILLNLLNNAIKFTHRGHITFATNREQQGEGNHTTDLLCFQVTDTGIGIESEKLESIFEAFNQADNSTTRRYEGTGLGLAISQHFSRLMGGQITVSSELGKGSVFTVRLPVWAVKIVV